MGFTPLPDFEDVTEFLEEVIEALTMDEEVRTFGEVMIPVFDIVLGRIKDLELCQILLYTYLDVLLYFTRQKDIAKVGAVPSQQAPRGFCCRGTFLGPDLLRSHPQHSVTTPSCVCSCPSSPLRKPVLNPMVCGVFYWGFTHLSACPSVFCRFLQATSSPRTPATGRCTRRLCSAPF